MRALFKAAPGPGSIEVREVPAPTIQNPDDVLIRVCAAGICGTDLHIFKGEFVSYPPVILGHEFSGIVEAVGSQVTGFVPGDRVVGEPHTRFCGKCDLCRAGKIQLCPEKRSPGWGMDGAFADALVMPELFLHKVPDSVELKTAALCEPLAIACTALMENEGVQSMDTVAVIGAGPVGLLSVVAAKAAGARRVFLLGTDQDEGLRFDIGRTLGANETVNVQKSDAEAILRRATSGRGADCVIEASGSSGGIATAASLLKTCGRMVVLGMPGGEKTPVPWLAMVKKSINVRFSFSSSVASWEKALSVMEQSPFDLSALITHEAGVDAWETAFSELEAGRAGKVFFVPGLEGYRAVCVP